MVGLETRGFAALAALLLVLAPQRADASSAALRGAESIAASPGRNRAAGPVAAGSGVSAAGDPAPAGALGPAAAEDVCAAFTTETEFVEFDLWLQLQERPVHLRFPAKYVDDPRSYRAGDRRTTSYIRVDIDTFEPISRYQDHLRFKAGVYDKMGVLLSDRVSLARQAPIDANLGSGKKQELEDYPERPGPAGLSQIMYDSLRDETFIARDAKLDITDVFWCDMEGSFRSPGCSQISKFFGVNISATYRRTHLHDWRNIRSRIEAFLTCASSIGSKD